MRFLGFVVMQVTLCLALLWVGRYTALMSLGSKVAAFRETTTLGAIPVRELRPGDSSVYYDVESNRDIESFCWTAPHVMTPFVGHGPEPGTSATAHTNLLQCRSTRQVRLPKPPGVVRIFTTGASTLWGSGASSDARTISGYLESMINADPDLLPGRRCEVFALANPAWASTHERIVIENRISEFEPDLVISLSGLNDVYWGLLGRNVLWFRSYADQAYFDVLNLVLERTGYAPMIDVCPWEPKPVPMNVVVERLQKNIRLALAALEPRHVPYVFFLQPIMPVCKKPLSPRENEDLVEMEPAKRRYFQQCFPLLSRALAAQQLPGFEFDDLTSMFDGSSASEEIFLDPYHFGDRGNERIAARILESIRPLLRAVH